MSTIYYTATTLDGFLADEHDSLDLLLSQDIDDRGPNNIPDFLASVGSLAMGATTYQWIRDHTGPDEWEYRQPTWVFTHRDLAKAAGDIRFASGPVEQVHAELVAAAGDKDVWVVGGGDLAGQFADAGLLDEIIVSVAPVSLGTGRPLLPRRRNLELLKVARNRAFACLHYRVGDALE